MSGACSNTRYNTSSSGVRSLFKYKIQYFLIWCQEPVQIQDTIPLHLPPQKNSSVTRKCSKLGDIVKLCVYEATIQGDFLCLQVLFIGHYEKMPFINSMVLMCADIKWPLMYFAPSQKAQAVKCNQMVVRTKSTGLYPPLPLDYWPEGLMTFSSSLLRMMLRRSLWEGVAMGTRGRPGRCDTAQVSTQVTLTNTGGVQGVQV